MADSPPLFIYSLYSASKPGYMHILAMGFEPVIVTMRADSPEEAIELANKAYPLEDKFEYRVKAVRN